MKVTMIFMVIAIVVCTMVQNSEQLYWNAPSSYSSGNSGHNAFGLGNGPLRGPPFFNDNNDDRFLPPPFSNIGKWLPSINGRHGGEGSPPRRPHCDCSNHRGDTTGTPTYTSTIEVSTGSGEPEITYSTQAPSSSEPPSSTTYYSSST